MALLSSSSSLAWGSLSLTREPAVQRTFSQINQMFSTQSLLYALGVGAKRTIAASAAINWMIKDGLGRLARMGVATSFGTFDSEIKARCALTSCPHFSSAGTCVPWCWCE